MKANPLKSAPILVCGLAIAIVCLLQALTLRSPKFELFKRLEWITYDWRIREANSHKPPVAQNIGFVDIGNDSIALVSDGSLGFQYGLVWPRHVYGRVLRELRGEGARVVGLDILFGELRRDHARVPGPDGKLVESDVFLAQQLRQAGNVVLGATREVVPHELFRGNTYAVGEISNERDSDGVLRRVKAFQDYRIWHSEIRRLARISKFDLGTALVQSNQIVLRNPAGETFTVPVNPDGFFNPLDLAGEKSSGGIVRLQRAFSDTRVWHMGVVMAAHELGLDLERAQVELSKGRIVLPGTNGVQRVLPVDGRGQFLIDWSLRVEDPRIAKQPIEALLARDNKRERGETNGLPDYFRDRLVVIGSTATGNDLSDRGATPLAKDTFLTSQHWNVINSVLLGRFITASSHLFELGMILLLGLGAALMNWKLRAISATVSVAGLGGLYLLAGLYAFVSFRYATPVVLPLLGLFTTHFGLLSYRVVFEQNERKRVKSVFAKIVSPNVVNELLRAEKLSLGGARRMITVFFADIRGFTEMTDVTQARAEEYVKTHHLSGVEAERYFEEQSRDVLGTVNLYLSIIADTVKKHGGTLDKYIGDCVMAFWGAPTPNEQHAVACVRSVVDAQRAIYALNQQRAAENTRRQQENQARTASGETPLPLLTLLTLGSGINTGIVTVGLMGSDAHIVNYTVFGRDVNLAARLEAFSGRGRIIIGEATFKELLRDDPALAGTCKELPPATMKGIRMAVKIYEVPWAQVPIAVMEDTQTHWRLKDEKVA